jgi:hypothetical protein
VTGFQVASVHSMGECWAMEVTSGY